MRPAEPNDFDPHCRPRRWAKVKRITKAIDATHEELLEAMEKVGSQPIAVAIFVDRPDAVGLWNLGRP